MIELPPHQALPARLPRPRWGRVAVFSAGIARIPNLCALLDAQEIVLRPVQGKGIDAVVGWGQKSNTAIAQRFAERHRLPYFRLEDGFLRSFELGISGAAPRSIVVDDLGIYYDARTPSRLETLIAAEPQRQDLEEAQRLIPKLRGLSKYNDQPAFEEPLLPNRPRRILVVDQSPGDLSLKLGLSDVPLKRLVADALEAHPDAEVWVKVHPDVHAKGKRSGAHDLLGNDEPRLRLLTEPVHPPSLFPHIDDVYVRTSQLGFEALIAGKRVVTYGAPWYAGWGLTEDRCFVPRRGIKRSLEALVAAAYLRYPRYVDPELGAATSAQRCAKGLHRQRRLAETNAGTTVCLGFSPWKRAFLPDYLGGPWTDLRFASGTEEARRMLEAAGSPKRLVVWGSSTDGDEVARQSDSDLWRVEDGFLRSAGLGSDFRRPLSLFVDRSGGIYYDSRATNDLEESIIAGDFAPDELAEAAALREHIVSQELTKYILDGTALPELPDAQDIVLVVGQVAGDASLRFGASDVDNNEALLRAVRDARPDAFLIYRPHPDVTSGNREGAVRSPERFVDLVLPEATISQLLEAATEVHTMTSLVGFEALLRRKRVVVYGQPFYAGWGLTEDRHPNPRRRVTRTIDELVVAAFLRGPLYIGSRTRLPVDALTVAAGLARHSALPPGRRVRKLRNLARMFSERLPSVAGSALRRLASLDPPEVLPPQEHSDYAKVLLLQGPSGPFMHRFAEELRNAGVAQVHKINFHAGEEHYFPENSLLGVTTTAFTGRMSEWPSFLRTYLQKHDIEAAFVFGDQRPVHQAAIAELRDAEVDIWAFEQGYLRPDWITLERNGVNGHSPLPKDPNFYQQWAKDTEQHATSDASPSPVGPTFGLAAWYETVNAVVLTHKNQRYPHYEAHRPLNAYKHAYWWVRGWARKKYFAHRERGLEELFRTQLQKNYFFVPLQVHCDYQLVHSPYEDIVDFIEEVVRSFAAHAPQSRHLVLKHHPMDRPFRDYTAFIATLAEQLGVGARVHYVHDLHVPTLLKDALGTITINSTVGLQSIHHGVPVHVRGDAVYDIPGLTHQESLSAFFGDPGTVDSRLYKNFRSYLLQHNQFNGSFSKPLPGCRTPTGTRLHRGG